MEFSVAATKQEVFDEGLSLTGMELINFCRREPDVCRNRDFWREKIHQETGVLAPAYLYLTQGPYFNLNGYRRLIQVYQDYYDQAPLYQVKIQKNFSEVAIPDEVLLGIGIARYVANLPITIYNQAGEELDLLQFALDNTFYVGDVDDTFLSRHRNRLRFLTFIFKSAITDETLVFTNKSLFLLLGYILAFQWVESIISVDWLDYLIGIYLKTGQQLREINLDQLV